MSYSGLDEFKEPEFKGYGPKNSKKESNVVCEKESDNSKENSDKSLKRTRTQPRIVNTARSYRTPVNTVRPRVVNTARQNRTSVNAAKANGFNAVKPSACWVWRPIKPNSASITLNRYNYTEMARAESNGCSRHMTSNIVYLSDFKKFDGGYVAFGGENVDNGEPKTVDDIKSKDEDAIQKNSAIPNYNKIRNYGLPNGKKVIGTKWVFRNKKDERGMSAFLYGTIEEEVYVTQPPGFKDPDHPDKVYKVLDLQKAKDAQAKEIAALKKRIHRFKRRKISRTTDASKQGRSIEDIDADVDVSFVDETQERQDDDLIFDTRVLDDVEIPVEAKVDGKNEQSTKKLDNSTAGEVVTTAGDDSVVPTTNEEITLAQTLIQIKEAKPKLVTTVDTTTTTTRPKDKGVVVQEPSEFRVPQEIKPSSSKDKGKDIMIEPEVPLKRKDQIALDEQIARDIQAKLDAELLEAQKLARKQKE
ncbi:hypothetical protein Tco_0008117 [Tanacetum coccineum]